MTQTHPEGPIASRRPSLLALGASGALVLAGFTTGRAAWALLSVILAPLPAQDVPDSAGGASFERSLAQWTAQIDGRSLFFTPAPPPPPPPPRVATEDAPPPPPPPPTRYTGPRPVAMIMDTVWFEGGTRLLVGGEGEGGLRVLGITPPWDLLVEWRGIEFTLRMVEPDGVVLPGDGGELAAGEGASAPPGAGHDSEDGS